MSTKTIKQRIAVVAVTALTAGFLSLVSAPVANAANNVAANDTQTAVLLEGTLNIATKASTTGTAVLDLTLATNVPTSLASVGLINVNDLTGGTTYFAGTTQTAVLLSTGTIVVYTEAETGTEGQLITVENGTLTGAVAGTGITSATNGARTAFAAYTASTTANNALAVAVTPNAGATTMTIRSYSKDSASSAAAHAVSSSQGTLTGQITVTIASASTAGVLSTARSAAYWGDAASESSLTADDAGQTGSTDYGRTLVLDVRVRDVYGSSITSSGLLQATATGGARVKANPGSLTDVGSSSTDYYSGAAPDSEEFLISNPTGAPMAGTVTITWQGTVIATRNYGFSGKVAKVELSSPVIGQLGGTGTSGNLATYKLFDAAGNAVYADYSGTDNTTTPPSGLAADTSLYGTVATSVSIGQDYSINTTTGVVTSGKVIFTCGSSAGSGTIGITYTNTDGTLVKSNALTVKCAGNAVKYTASYDKAVYAPGEIATLTLKFLDSKGNAANDIADVDSDGTAGEISISTSGMAQTVSGPSDTGVSGADIDQGELVFKYAVGINEGTYTNVINVPDVNEAATSANLTGTAAVSATFTVKASGTVVTSNDILKSIVSLIASINKQIQALQKLILKRR
jgi:hypothetical protein